MTLGYSSEELRGVKQESEKSHRGGQRGLKTTGHLIKDRWNSPGTDPPEVKEAGVRIV